MLLTLSILTVVILLVGILYPLKNFFIKRKVSIVNREEFIYLINEEKLKKNKILLVFDNGYWEVKEEIKRKEWTAQGTIELIDFDSNINDKLYKKMMGEFPVRNSEGVTKNKIIKEIELTKDFNPETYHIIYH